MKRLSRPWLAGAVLLPTVVVAMTRCAAALVLQRKPLVVERTAVSATDVARVVQQLRHHDPRRFPPGTPRSAVLAAHDIELLLNHGARRWAADTPVRLTVLPGSARLQTSRPARRLPFDFWINLESTLQESVGLPTVTGGRIGRLPVPGWLAQAIAHRAGLGLGVDIEAPWAREVVQGVRLQRDAITVRYTPGRRTRGSGCWPACCRPRNNCG